MGYFRKNPNRRGVEAFLKTLLEFFILLLYPWKFQTKQNSTTKLCQVPWKFQGEKQRALEIPHYFFLVSLAGNSTSFLINPWKFHMLFFDTPGNSMSCTPPVWTVSGIAQYSFKDRSTLPGPTSTGSLEVVLSN